MHRETVVTREALVGHCWDEMADPVSNVVDAVMAGLRRKLGSPPLIRTVRGHGFLLGGDARTAREEPGPDGRDRGRPAGGESVGHHRTSAPARRRSSPATRDPQAHPRLQRWMRPPTGTAATCPVLGLF